MDGEARLFLDWDSATVPNVSYKVQIYAKTKASAMGLVNAWADLPVNNFTINFLGSAAIVGGLDFNRTYPFRVVNVKRGTNGQDDLETIGPELPAKVPLPFWGHQADHTVQYVLGTPAATPGPTSASPPNIQDIIDDAIDLAAQEWNSSSIVRICKQGECPTGVDDRKRVTITITGKSTCGVACVCAVTCGNDLDPPYGDHTGHSNHLEMIILQPPSEGRQPLVWTNTYGDDSEEVPGHPGHRYEYLPDVIMHEFGHTLGLLDLNEYAGIWHLLSLGLLGGYDEYIMGWPDKPFETLPSKDVEYLGDVYRNHTAHEVLPPGTRDHQ